MTRNVLIVLAKVLFTSFTQFTEKSCVPVLPSTTGCWVCRAGLQSASLCRHLVSALLPPRSPEIYAVSRSVEMSGH